VTHVFLKVKKVQVEINVIEKYRRKHKRNPTRKCNKTNKINKTNMLNRNILHVKE
jgi:hypothetical protein